MPLTLEAVNALAKDYNALGLEADYSLLRLCTEEEVRAFFESGGEMPHPMPKMTMDKDFLPTEESAAAPEAEAEGADDEVVMVDEKDEDDAIDGKADRMPAPAPPVDMAQMEQEMERVEVKLAGLDVVDDETLAPEARIAILRSALEKDRGKVAGLELVKTRLYAAIKAANEKAAAWEEKAHSEEEKATTLEAQLTELKKQFSRLPRSEREKWMADRLSALEDEVKDANNTVGRLHDELANRQALYEAVSEKRDAAAMAVLQKAEARAEYHEKLHMRIVAESEEAIAAAEKRVTEMRMLVTLQAQHLAGATPKLEAAAAPESFEKTVSTLPAEVAAALPDAFFFKPQAEEEEAAAAAALAAAADDDDIDGDAADDGAADGAEQEHGEAEDAPPSPEGSFDVVDEGDLVERDAGAEEAGGAADDDEAAKKVQSTPSKVKKAAQAAKAAETAEDTQDAVEKSAEAALERSASRRRQTQSLIGDAVLETAEEEAKALEANLTPAQRIALANAKRESDALVAEMEKERRLRDRTRVSSIKNDDAWRVADEEEEEAVPVVMKVTSTGPPKQWRTATAGPEWKKGGSQSKIKGARPMRETGLKTALWSAADGGDAEVEYRAETESKVSANEWSQAATATEREVVEEVVPASVEEMRKMLDSARRDVAQAKVLAAKGIHPSGKLPPPNFAAGTPEAFCGMLSLPVSAAPARAKQIVTYGVDESLVRAAGGRPTNENARQPAATKAQQPTGMPDMHNNKMPPPAAGVPTKAPPAMPPKQPSVATKVGYGAGRAPLMPSEKVKAGGPLDPRDKPQGRGRRGLDQDLD